ncbi:hypothetical protein CVT25_003408 [Psilocybe cyanescens]|uniref:Uncharacterized protein n=1 Tax=Psilocybe cyanescens TaxID=93625 RepID=A0A409WLY3_PSICY|nr:hypothetical protein CVT25_003408 [Psilocybe cyanescens]
MVPLVSALILAFVPFISSAFVILRIFIPILPPHPLSELLNLALRDMTGSSFHCSFIHCRPNLDYPPTTRSHLRTRVISGSQALTSVPSQSLFGKLSMSRLLVYRASLLHSTQDPQFDYELR